MIQIRILIGGAEVRASLDNNATARDFLSLLPMTVTLKDYHNTEKISDLPKRLSIDGAPDGFDPSVGDITYFAPWGNLAIFYRDFGFSQGLIRIGRITSGIEALRKRGSLTAEIERAE